MKPLSVAAVGEGLTGFALLVSPLIMVKLLFGVQIAGIGIVVGRVAGIALIALGLACWPNRQRTESGSSASLAMLAYSVLIAPYLTYLGTAGHLGGLLLWPAVVLHAVVALLLVWTWRNERQTKATNK